MTTPKTRPSIVYGEAHSYPVLPLRDIVVFPHNIVPLFVGREKSIRALEEVMRNDALVMLGGGQNALADNDYPYFPSLLGLIRDFESRNRSVLGICLGAQLLAHAAGARVYPNVKMAPPAGPGQPPKPVEPTEPLPEIGWGAVNLPFPGGTEPLMFGVMDGTPMFHWHFDTFDLPAFPKPQNPPPGPPPPTGNALMSSTRTCRNQAFRFKNRLFGFQYHIELDRAGIAQIIAGNREQAVQVLGSDAEAKINADTERFYPRYERATNKILTNFVQFLKAYAEKGA